MNFSFEGSGFFCEDVNECQTGQSLCSGDAECVNNVGNYTCQCKKGFHGDGEVCFGKFHF